MKQKFITLLLLIFMLAVFGNSAMASDNLFPVGTDLSVPVYCARYQNIAYGFTLRYAPIPLDGLYWKMDIGTFTQVADTQTGCLQVGDDVALNLSVIYQDVVYDVVLRYFPYADDTQGLYWKMDMATFQQKDSLGDFAADIIRAESEGNAALFGSRTSASYRHDGMDYNCLMEYSDWDYSHYSYSNVAYFISGIVYENRNGISLAKITRDKTVTEYNRDSSETRTYSNKAEKILVFENGRWKLYGNQKSSPSVSASWIVTCTSLDEEKWEPVGEKQSFTSTDQAIGVFAEIQNIHNKSSYQFKLFKPDGSLVHESDEGRFDWGDYPPCISDMSSVYYSFDIEELWNASPGQWKVEVYADGQKAGEVYFEYK